MMEFDLNGYVKQLFGPNPDFAALEQSLWEYQSLYNPVMHNFCEELGNYEQISFPIEGFKRFDMKTGDWEHKLIFESSGTTGQIPSRHFVKDSSIYERNVIHGFHSFFPAEKYRILGLLPSYLERGNSSLVYMVKTWMDHFGLPGSGFFLNDFEALTRALWEGAEAGEPIILIGVAFALLDYAELHPVQLPPQTIVIETGGMKGRKEELIRSELHERLKNGLGIDLIRSEYGMTELMSQAYTDETGRFRTAPTMRVFVSDIYLNRLIEPPGVSGRLHIVDLANIHTCGFIATDDIGRMHPDGSFEVLGRLDHAEMRGCNLMYI